MLDNALQQQQDITNKQYRLTVDYNGLKKGTLIQVDIKTPILLLRDVDENGAINTPVL